MEYIKAKKSYGQNFLKNQEILFHISSVLPILSDDLVIEIGPGMGALTEFLVQKKSYFLAYEIDERMKEYLEKYNTEKAKIIYGDFLKRNIVEDIKGYSYKHLYVVANIPYYITSPIIKKLVELEIPIDAIVLLVQKEVAERITADSNQKEYNAFTLFVDYRYDASFLFPVLQSDFVPAPKVDSAVIKLVRKDINIVLNKEFYLQFIKDAFWNKRKTLKNNLKNYDWNKISKILNHLGYSDNVRAEEISKEHFKILANRYREV